MSSRDPSRDPSNGDAFGSEDHPEPERLGRSTAERNATSEALLERIAATLGVPTSVLFDLPNAVPEWTGAHDAAELADSLNHQSLEMIRAFRRIDDPKERRRLLALVQEAAERG